MSSIEAIQHSDSAASAAVLPNSDTELLHRFVSERSDSAFEELMRRHGPMVMGLCRRVLPKRHDAEDAFQTTFLLLVQKSGTIRRPERLANWLFGVAYRVAARIRTKARKKESLGMHSLEIPAEDNSVEVARRELQSVLDEEIHRLPEAYRLPLILCYLEGKTHVEAARQLGWPSGSMSSRVTQAREKLRRRLARRGLSLTSALFAMLLGEKTYGAELSPLLIEDTTRAAKAYASGEPLLADAVSTRITELLAEVNVCLRFARVREVTVLLSLLMLMLGSTGFAVRAVHGEVNEWAVRRGKPVPSFTVNFQSGQSAFFSLTRSAEEGLADVRNINTAAAPNVNVSPCGQH